MKQKNLIIEGPPGAGKGTIAQFVSEALHIPHISTGDILRKHIAQHDALGKLAQPYLEQGKFIPDNITHSIMEQRLSKDDVLQGFILDGYPRDIQQTTFVLETYPITGVIRVELEDEAIINRLAQRRVCPQCGATYHLETKPPQKKGVCDKDASILIHREDDKPATIKKRLGLYHEQIEDILELFKKQNIPIVSIRGDFDIATQKEDVIHKIRKELSL